MVFAVVLSKAPLRWSFGASLGLEVAAAEAVPERAPLGVLQDQVQLRRVLRSGWRAAKRDGPVERGRQGKKEV